MALDKDFVIFDNITFSGLSKKIYNNVKKKDGQLSQLISQMAMKTTEGDQSTLVLVLPIIRDYIELSVRNDESLIKLAAIVQRGISGGSVAQVDEIMLSEADKKALIDEFKGASKELLKDDIKTTILPKVEKPSLGREIPEDEIEDDDDDDEEDSTDNASVFGLTEDELRELREQHGE